MPYDLSEHRHRFALWAAARAAQRGHTTVINLRDALESTDIRSFLEKPESFNTGEEGYKENHRRWCQAIVGFLDARGVAGTTYGRAAKLVAIYVKAMVITTQPTPTKLACFAHPPIDRVLLQNLASSAEINSPYKRHWRTVAWTQLDENGYYALVEQLRTLIPDGEPFWMLEKYWNVTNSLD